MFDLNTLLFFGESSSSGFYPENLNFLYIKIRHSNSNIRNSEGSNLSFHLSTLLCLRVFPQFLEPRPLCRTK